MGPGLGRNNGAQLRRTVPRSAKRPGRSAFAAAAPPPNARPNRYRRAKGQPAKFRRSGAPASHETPDQPDTSPAAAPREFQTPPLREARLGRRHGALRRNPGHARDTATSVLQPLARSISTARNPSLSHLAGQLGFKSMTVGRRISFAAG